MTQKALFLAAATLVATPAAAQDNAFGGQAGANMAIEAIEPSDVPIDIGMAGDDPADIARYLLASGAGTALLSPDGQSIAFSWDVTGQPELWILPVAGGQPQQLTFLTGVDMFRWMPDSSGLLYGADRDGNEQQGYYWIAADGLSEKVLLPPADGDFRQFGDFVGDDGFVYASTLRNGLDFDIYRANLEGESELIYEGHYNFSARSVSPDGRYVVVTEAVGEDADNLYLLDLETRELTTIDAPPVEDRAAHDLGGFAWRPDSSSFLFSTNSGREFGALTSYDLATGEMQTMHAPQSEISDIEICASGAVTAFAVSHDGFDHIMLTGEGGMRALAGLPEGSFAIDCAGSDLLVRVNGWNTPGDVFTVDVTSDEVTRVFASNLAGLDPDSFVFPRVVRYPARDGVELQGLLYLPEGAGTGEYAPPVIFNVHGGPSGQARPIYNAVAQYHVNRGVAVFAPNVRGSTGLGRTYSTLDDREKRLDSVRDLVDLLDALGAEGLVDADRAAVMGGSYGGYMVNAVLSEYPEAFAAGVSLFGVGNWITALEIASPALKASDRIEYGDISEQRWRDFYGEMSPVFRADRIRVPVLYSHGAQDPRIDISETEIMVQALRDNGIEAEFVRIPDEGHGWRKLSNQLFYHRLEAEFIEDKLGE